jgi:hypothetical protein
LNNMSGTNYIASNWRTPTNQNSSKNDNCGNDPQIQLTGDISISAWFKTSDIGTMIIAAKRDSPLGGSTYGWQVYCTGGKIAFVVTRSGPTSTTFVGTTTISDGAWHHVLCTINQASQIAIILDGQTEGTASLPAGTFIDSNSDLRIGYNQVGSQDYYFNGEISEVALFDYLASGATLYGNATSGSGNPMALKPTPVGYWPLGDNSASDPLTQPNVAVEDASVFDFFGSISISLPEVIYSGAFTFSFWLNPDNLTLSFIGGDINSNSYFIWLLSTNEIRLKTNSGSYTFTESGGNDIVVGSWQNITITRDGSDNVKAFRNGVPFGGTSVLAGDFKLNSIGEVYSAIGTWFFNGEMSNVAMWNSDQSSEISNIYNSGVPATSYTNTPTAWYKLDQSANWEADTAGDWQIPDAVSEFPQSFNFSPADEYFDTGNNPLIGASNLSISAWFNSADVDPQYLLGDSSVRFSIKQSNGDTRISFTGSTDPFRGFGIPYNISEWNHLILTFDGSLVQADRLKLYHNGVEINNINAGTPNTTLLLNTAVSFMIGRVGGTSLNTWNGKISNVQLWDITLDQPEVTTLYNGGTPTLTPPNQSDLKAWWKLDNTATFSTNWTVPDASGNGNDGTSVNMTEQSLVNNNVSALNGESSGMTSGNLVLSDLTRNLPYENYSLSFDSGTDYIECGNISGLNGGLTEATWSGWFNRSSSGTFYIMGTYGTGQIQFFVQQGNNYITAYAGNSVGAQRTMSKANVPAWTIGQWYHFAFVYDEAESSDADKMKIYIDGILQANAVAGSSLISLNSSTASFDIGRLTGTASNQFVGKISNVAIWNNALSSTEAQNLYANGMPQDLTTFTPQPINWWTLGKESFWDGADWIIRDMIGTNDAVSANMGGGELKGDAPRSQANGVGTNIAVPTNLKGEAGWSDKNGYSINMSSTARTTDTP